ncbi:MAG: PfkB family carbohydrate kinase, partial [Paracoccaceae bacterium]
VSTNAIIDSTRPTVNKNAFVVGGYRLLKVDTIDNRSISEQILKEMTSAVSQIPTDAVVYSDFRHGIFNRRTIPTFIQALPKNVYTVADSQVASRWGNVTEFQGFDLITPNEREVRFALADQDSGIRPIASQVYDKAACKLLMMKLGERGMLVCRGPDHESSDSFYVIDTFVDNLVDAVGAGDALMAYATIAMLVSKNDCHASILGAIAAACECEHHGNVPIIPNAMHQKIDAIEKRMNFA